MRLAFSMLCENPVRKTGLTTFFHEFLSHSVRLAPDISWILFLGPHQEWTVTGPGIQLVRDFPANDQLKQRILADHCRVPARARQMGADALLTVGFVPLRKTLPTVMHMFSLQHLDSKNRLGTWREFYRTWVTRWSMPRADLIVTGSNFAASQVTRAYPAVRERLLTSYEGLQHAQFHPTPAPDEIPNLKKEFQLNPGYFLWLSNFYPYKQADLLLNGYARLDAGLREKHPLVMVGGNWVGELERLQQQARQLGITQNLRFPGWIADEWLAPLYRHALAFCLPSREETFGKSVTEAMACGTPCIVNDLEIMHEVTGGHALIVDFNNTAQVADTLRTVALDADVRRKLGAEGRQQAARFSYETLTSERLDAIRQLVAGTNPARSAVHKTE